jgi:hypothetical protein
VNLTLVKQALDHRAISSTIYVGTSDLLAAEAMMAMY